MVKAAEKIRGKLFSIDEKAQEINFILRGKWEVVYYFGVYAISSRMATEAKGGFHGKV